MTGDWACAVQILRRVHIQGSEVPLVVLKDINLILKIFIDLNSLYNLTHLIEFVTGNIV